MKDLVKLILLSTTVILCDVEAMDADDWSASSSDYSDCVVIDDTIDDQYSFLERMRSEIVSIGGKLRRNSGDVFEWLNVLVAKSDEVDVFMQDDFRYYTEYYRMRYDIDGLVHGINNGIRHCIEAIFNKHVNREDILGKYKDPFAILTLSIEKRCGLLLGKPVGPDIQSGIRRTASLPVFPRIH